MHEYIIGKLIVIQKNVIAHPTLLTKTLLMKHANRGYETISVGFTTSASK